MKTRILACLLSVLMLVSMIPVSVSAADPALITQNVVWNDGDIINGATIQGNVTITVKGTVTITGTINIPVDTQSTVTFQAGTTDAKLIRGASFDGQMFYAEGVQGKFHALTFDGITLDGGAVWTGEEDETLKRGTTNAGVKATGSVLYLVYTEATLKNSVLQNHDDSTGEKANAVFLRYYSKLNVNDSIIRNNNSIATYYRGGVVTIRQGGTVKTNNAEVYGNSGAAGGFVGISATGSYGGVVEAYQSEFHNNYSDNGAVFLMQCNSKIGYLLIDGCEFYNNASKTAVLTEWAYSRPFIIKNSSFYDNACAVWDCHTDPVLDISGKIMVFENQNYTKYLFETPLVLGGALATGSSIAVSEASIAKLMNSSGYILTGSADYAITEADLEKFVLPNGYKLEFLHVNTDYITDAVAVKSNDTHVNVTVHDNFNGSTVTETLQMPTTVVGLPAVNFSHEGYDFVGWMTSADGTEVIDPQKFTGDIELYAKWSRMVAKVGDTKYETLAEAITAANAAGTATVELLANVDVSETMTIDGNVTIEGAYTITWADNTKNLFVVNSGATLTFDGGVTIDGGNNWVLDEALYNQYLYALIEDEDSLVTAITKNPSGTEMYPLASENGKADFGATAHLIKNSGTLNVNKATIENFFSFKVSPSRDNAYAASSGYSVIWGNNNSVLNLNKGAVIQHNASGSHGVVANNYDCTYDTNINKYTEINVNGATIQNNFAGSNGGVFKVYRTTLNIKDGLIYNNKATDSNGSVVQLYGAAAILNLSGGKICSNSSIYGYNNGRTAAIYPHASSTINMSGGTICCNTGYSRGGIYVNYNAGDINITGGEVINNKNVRGDEQKDIYCGPTAAAIFDITGGSFTQDVTEWCAEGYAAPYDEATGTYTVVRHTDEQCAPKMECDENGHWTVCSVCGDILSESVAHTSAYDYNSTHHWTACAECGYILGAEEEHTFVKGVCTICEAAEEGYVAPPAIDYVLFALAARYAQKYDVIVTAENATVTGDLAIKYKRNGTVDIAPADGYKVVDVIANGISLGAVDSVTFKQVKAPQTLVVITEKLYTNPYSDIADDNAAVQYVTENGLMIAAEEGLFAPEAEATRALLAEVLYALAGKPEVDATVTVNDAEDAAILWAAANGILTPNADGLVEPDTVITLADLNAALNAYAGTTDVAYVEFDAEAEVAAATRADLANAIYLFCTIPAEG